MLSIRSALRNRRKDKQLSQAQVADTAAITQAMVSKFESGQDLHLSTLEQIADALDMRIIAIPKENSLRIDDIMNSPSRTQEAKSLLERFQVKDDE